MYTYKFSIAELSFFVESELELELSRSILSAPIDPPKYEHMIRVMRGSRLDAVGRQFAEDMGKRFFDTEKGICTQFIEYSTDLPMIRTITEGKLTEVVVLEKLSKVRGDMLLSALDLPYILLSAHRLILHAASIEVKLGTERGAILFSAPSGTGKSTQAALWEKHRSAIQLNGDKAAVGCEGGKALAYGFPFCGTSGICSDYKLPILAIVFLRQSPENHIESLRGAAAIRSIMNNAFGHSSLPGYLDRMLGAAAPLLTALPILQLDCTPDERAVELLERTLLEKLDRNK